MRCNKSSLLCYSLTFILANLASVSFVLGEELPNRSESDAASSSPELQVNAPQTHLEQQKQPQPMVHHAQPPIESDSGIAAAPIPPMLMSTTLKPQPEKSVPDYLKNCFYAEEELCLNWYENNNHDSGTPTTHPVPAAITLKGSAGTASSSDESMQTQANFNNGNNRDINSCQCRAYPNKPNAWYCCNITHITMISSCSNFTNWTYLHVRNMTITQIDLVSSIYRFLQSLAITDGSVTKVVNTFPRNSAMKCVNISNNNIDTIPTRVVKNAVHLEFLDTSKNNLTRVPNWNQNRNITMDISGNPQMPCDTLHEAINSDSFKFANPEKSFCLYNATHQWFNSTDYVSIKQLERTKQCRTKCPTIEGHGNCTCYQDKIMIIQSDQPKSVCNVDCSNLGLTKLPEILPDNTFTLNITNNKITSLGDHFHKNPAYHNIDKLLADNNQISSILELEGTKFIEHFQRIYMRNNSLSKIPEYFLNNAFMDIEHGRRIYLAGNKLQCDCNTAKTLPNWLKERSNDIPDYMEIKCRNLPQSVIELQETKLCQAPPDWTDYIYYLIAAEVILLVALITKVSYDYWVFKTSGYLPWPASKMPKLPCDWLCES